jgi:(E)-4-hydroxy-3-methylbut-2-enyl-diphosphate synthase
MKQRIKTRQISIGNVKIGGDAPISVQSMTFSKTYDIKATIEQINKLHFAGADIVRVTIPDEKSANALKEIIKEISIPIVADIHFKYKLALISSEYVDAIRINPGNIGSKDKIKAVVQACKAKNIPIRIGVNAGSIEKNIEKKFGTGHEAMVESALYNIKYLEDLDFFDIKVSMKASDIDRTILSYRTLRPLVDYPFHLGVTEAGTKFHSTIKSSIALGSLLYDGIGDTMRISMTGELEEEIKVAKGILKNLGLIKDGLNIISCPTCGRIEANLVSAIEEIEEKTKHIKKSLDVSVMGCVVNAIGEAKHSNVAIAYGKKSGLIMVDGEIVAKLDEKELVDRFINEIEQY